MASNTTNYGWTKPDYEDDADIMVINDTIDNIDAQVKANADVAFSPGTEIIGTSDAHQDLDNYTGLGVYFCRNSTNAGYVDNKPVGGSGFRLTVENISGTNTFRQTFIKPTEPNKIYVRHYSTSNWSAWYVFEGTSLT